MHIMEGTAPRQLSIISYSLHWEKSPFLMENPGFFHSQYGRTPDSTGSRVWIFLISADYSNFFVSENT